MIIYIPERNSITVFTLTKVLKPAIRKKASAIFILKIEAPHMDGDCTEPGYEESPQWEVAHFHS